MGNLGETGKIGLAGLRDGLRLGHYVKGPSLRSVHSDFGELGDHRLGAVLAGSTDRRLYVIAPVRKPNENETRYADRARGEREHSLERKQTRYQRETDCAGAKIVA